MMQSIERYMKQAIVDRNPAVSSAALVSSLVGNGTGLLSVVGSGTWLLSVVGCGTWLLSVVGNGTISECSR